MPRKDSKVDDVGLNWAVKIQRINHARPANGYRPTPPARKPSTKRQAPAPPGQHPGARRVVSSDREDRMRPMRTNGEGIRRVASSDRGLQHPPQRRQLGRKTSMGDALDSSYSESEGLNDQVRMKRINNTI